MAVSTYIIADNQALTRLGWISLLLQKVKQSDILLAESKVELKNRLQQEPQSLVIMDIELFDWEGIDEMAAFAAKFPQALWLSVGEGISERLVHQLTRELPAAGIVLKTSPEEELLTAITSLASGKKYYCSEALEIVLGNKARPAVSGNKLNALLTATEKEIIHLLAQGKSTKDIANERCLSPHTVITHRKNIFRKLEVNTVYELTKYAIKNGLADFTEYYI